VYIVPVCDAVAVSLSLPFSMFTPGALIQTRGGGHTIVVYFSSVADPSPHLPLSSEVNYLPVAAAVYELASRLWMAEVVRGVGAIIKWGGGGG